MNLKSGVEMGGFDASKDYYSILGAAEGATKSEIERLYKRQAVRHHPDRGGSEERMKTLNEAYKVLRDAETRSAYDAERRHAWTRRSREMYRRAAPVAASPGARADAVYGRFAGALLLTALGLVLLLLVRFQWIWFLWPLAVLASVIILFGVLMAHSGLRIAREAVSAKHPFRRFRAAQEALFWSAVSVGVYGVYLLMTAV